MSAETMQAWRLQGFGVDQLKVDRVPLPEPGPTEILVEVSAVALNYRDLLVMDGAFLPDLERPFVPCSDAVGRVVAVGEEVERFTIGERVLSHYWVDWIEGAPPVPDLSRARSLGGPLQGVLAEYVVLDQAHAVRAPHSLSDAEAATLPIAGLTAFAALLEGHPVDSTSSVLVQGTGGVACFAIQFAASVGAHVIALSSSDRKLDVAQLLGASHTVNYHANPDWDRLVLELTGGHGVDRIIELVGGNNLERSLRALTFNGEIAQIGFLASPEARFPLPTLMLHQARIRGVAVGHRAAFERMVAWIDEHGLAPQIDAQFPFAAAPDAFRKLHAGPLGKVVLVR
ncbi:zinc-dependent alcohol dehydrogenase family protein [Spiribacter halobius]|uniref:Alcohol dehydrogenase n=1 Tax=Sediminicurvatus halobius TaxID=2182432 RepID=A0A2U2MWA1_9GAMM|nr:NAD(P)-dependent alcohol dehydrogenase [Spiribacter halobius]PWG61139.1 alcohol dehydrogenase [Spiribacter halobius]UEX77701.1 NAD(P)-dependent alcohol dehydrogenase [Spiribacter halobius]